MISTVVEIDGKKIVETAKNGFIISEEKDTLALLGICGSSSANRLLIFEENLSEDFFDLRSGLAGSVLQKFINYRIRVAAIISPERIGNGRFAEMVMEANRGNDFRVFPERDKAIAWLSAE